MRSRPLLTALLAFASTPVAVAQERIGFEKVPLRVVSVSPGTGVVVDRGKSDLLEAGDRVLLTPRGRGSYWGTVLRADERTAVVEVDDPTAVVPPGTRGEANIPKSRVTPTPPVEPPPTEPAPVQPAPVAPTPEPQVSAEQQGPPAHPPWPQRDEPWQAGEPLLAKVRPVRPRERPTTFSGRVWSIGDLVRVPADTGSDYANSQFRVGTALEVDNPFGQGGGLHFDGEIYHRTEWNETAHTHLLVRGLSYHHGGTRFAPVRWEAGRFLQSGMPEFGFLDGFEIDRRLSSGSRYGASIGWLPELNDTFESGRDFQVAGYYHWAQDDRELLTFSAGFQATFHDSHADRHLLILKGRALDQAGWDLLASAWLDLYFGADDQKNGIGLTYGLFSASRGFADGSGLEIAYQHQEFPQFLRDDYLPVTADQLANDRTDRAWIDGDTPLGDSVRGRGELGVWNDEDDTGGSAELGLDLLEAFLERDDLQLTLFSSIGRFEKLLGGRVVYGRSTDLGRWEVLYELADHRIDSRPSDGNDLLQHRIRASQSFYTSSGWTWSLQADAVFWDTTITWAAGFTVQKTF